MSGTLLLSRRRVRNLLRDLDPSAYAFPTPEVDAELNGCVTDIAARLRLGETWTTGLVTLVAGTASYALSGSAEYGSLVKFRTASDGRDIPVVSRQEFDAFREGQTVAAPMLGVPLIATLYETTAQATRLDLWPTPVAADTLDAFFTVLPLGVSLTSDASTIPFDTLGLEALAHECAGRLCVKSSREKLAQMGLDADVGKAFLALAEGFVVKSRNRRHAQSGVGRTRRGRKW